MRAQSGAQVSVPFFASGADKRDTHDAADELLCAAYSLVDLGIDFGWFAGFGRHGLDVTGSAVRWR